MGERWAISNTAKAWKRALAHGIDPWPNGGGFALPVDQLIAIEPDLPRRVERRVLMHELAHVCLEIGGWTEEVIAPGQYEEVAACALERPLVSLWRDNPALVAYMTA